MDTELENIRFEDLSFKIETAKLNNDTEKVKMLEAELSKREAERNIEEREWKKFDTIIPRLLALIIDIIIFIPIIYAEEAFLKLLGFETLGNEILMGIYAFDIYFYSILMHYYFGKTVGKKITGVKVLTIHEKRLDIKHAVLRDIIQISITVIYVSGVLSLILPSSPVSPGINISLLIATFPTIWLLLEVLTALINKKHRAIHDYIAGTVVIREH